MIEFRKVTKRYPGQAVDATAALDGISFHVNAGEVFGYIGPNGAGKTTTIKILVGLIRDYDGTVSVSGRDIRSGEAPLHRTVGYMPQSSGFQQWRTVSHTLDTFGRLSGLESPDLERKIDTVLERVELTDYRKTRLTHLSGGTLQRLRLAQAILHEPEVLVLDEPMSGLDPASRFRFKTIITEYAMDDRLVFFSSHILSDVEDLATRIGVISDGTMRRAATPVELREEYSLGQIVELEIADDASTLETERFAIPSIDHVSEITPFVVRLYVAPGHELDDAISDILEICRRDTIRVRRLQHLKPSLEEVYLKLTSEDEEHVHGNAEESI